MAGRAPAPKLILASSSPRRLDLLARLGVTPDLVVAPGVDENPLPRETPRLLARRLARQKAMTMSGSDSYVLAADTVVGVGRRCLPNPADPAVARKCLALLSGRRHKVYTAVALRRPDGHVLERMVVTSVTFARLGRDQLDAYIASQEWLGKAGGYAIQGHAEGFVRALSGSYSGVVGLPLHETAGLLRSCGWRIL